MDQLVKRIEAAPLMEPQYPWKKIGAWEIGGMRAIGFSDCSRYILVETTDGRGLFSCKTGKKIARDRDKYKSRELELLCDGFGPLSGHTVRMAGLHGGGLLTCTSDDWEIVVISSWSKKNILLIEPGSWLYGKKYGKPDNFNKIWSGYEVRGCGFSYSGTTLCVGESSDLVIYSKCTD